MTNEVVIIGAGATGLSSAIFLNEKGYEVSIYEKRTRQPITKALGINPKTLELFSKSGITERFLSNGWKLEKSNFWYQNKHIYQNDFSRVKHPYPFMIIQPQHETEQILEEYLVEKSICVNRNFDLKSIISTTKQTTLTFEHLQSEKHHTISTNGIVIGADGSRSTLRTHLNIALQGWEHNDIYTLYDIELDTPLAKNELHYIFHQEGGMLMLHIRDNIWRVGGNIANVLERLPKGTSLGKITWQTNFTIREMVAEKFREKNIFLLGDAAHVHSPLGGKGMNMCIEDAAILAQMLADNKEDIFATIRRKKMKKTIGVLGQLTEVVGGKHPLGRFMRGQMDNFSFLFPIFMPQMRKFLLGLS